MNLDKDIVNAYYNCLDYQTYGNYLPMCIFKESYKNEFNLITKINQRRNSINKSINAMFTLNRQLYFGTLTFNVNKDKNKIKTKRREAFIKMNKIFEYFLLVEEYGEDKGRYHLHLIGIFNSGITFDNYRKVWHSRQNLKYVNDNHYSNYIMKYVTKDIPRVRRNKKLVQLTNIYKKYSVLYENFKSEKSFNPVTRCREFDFLSVID